MVTILSVIARPQVPQNFPERRKHGRMRKASRRRHEVNEKVLAQQKHPRSPMQDGQLELMRPLRRELGVPSKQAYKNAVACTSNYFCFRLAVEDRRSMVLVLSYLLMVETQPFLSGWTLRNTVPRPLLFFDLCRSNIGVILQLKLRLPTRLLSYNVNLDKTTSWHNYLWYRSLHSVLRSESKRASTGSRNCTAFCHGSKCSVSRLQRQLKIALQFDYNENALPVCELSVPSVLSPRTQRKEKY
jgi:hypothetical protein